MLFLGGRGCAFFLGPLVQTGCFELPEVRFHSFVVVAVVVVVVVNTLETENSRV